MFCDSCASEVAALHLATGDSLDRNFTRIGITPSSAEKSCNFLSEGTVKRISMPEMLSSNHVADDDAPELITEIRMGRRRSFFSASVDFLLLTGRLLNMPIAAAFPLSDSGDEMILTMLPR